jgi:hypothetical protein
MFVLASSYPSPVATYPVSRQVEIQMFRSFSRGSRRTRRVFSRDVSTGLSCGTAVKAHLRKKVRRYVAEPISCQSPCQYINSEGHFQVLMMVLL